MQFSKKYLISYKFLGLFFIPFFLKQYQQKCIEFSFFPINHVFYNKNRHLLKNTFILKIESLYISQFMTKFAKKKPLKKIY